MAKKLNFDNTIQKVDGITKKVDVIMRNRLIIAIFLIVDGITFLLNPETTLPEMARNIILIIFFAAFTVLITNLATKTKDKKTIMISILILILGGVFYFYPDIIAAYMQLLLALFVIYDGLANIASVLSVNNKLSRFTDGVARKYNQLAGPKKLSKEEKAKREKFKVIDDNINEGLEGQKEKLITPLKNLVNKTNKSSVLFIIANSISVILGIVLLIFPDVSMAVWGLIFLYTGFSNLSIAMRSMNLSKKIKERKFKEIIFDAENENRKKTCQTYEKYNKNNKIK